MRTQLVWTSHRAIGGAGQRSPSADGYYVPAPSCRPADHRGHAMVGRVARPGYPSPPAPWTILPASDAYYSTSAAVRLPRATSAEGEHTIVSTARTTGRVPPRCHTPRRCRHYSKDYSGSLLAGGADNATRFHATDALLSLQRRPMDVLHRDDFFPYVHQPLNCGAAPCFRSRKPSTRWSRKPVTRRPAAGAARRLAASSLPDNGDLRGILSPWSSTIRTVLVTGLGFESPDGARCSGPSQRLAVP